MLAIGLAESSEAPIAVGSTYRVDVLANCLTIGDVAVRKVVDPISLDETGEPAVVGLPLTQVWPSSSIVPQFYGFLLY